MKGFTEMFNRYKNVDLLYARLPELECKQLCQESCGPILMSKIEWERIIERLGYEPVGDASLKCPMLAQDGKCSVYDIRPAICRLYGMVKKLACEHKCVPKRWVSDDEARKLLAKINSE